MGDVIQFPSPAPAGVRYLTKREVADHLRVSVRSVERYHADGLPHYRLRGINLYRVDLVDAWVHNQQV